MQSYSRYLPCKEIASSPTLALRSFLCFVPQSCVWLLDLAHRRGRTFLAPSSLRHRIGKTSPNLVRVTHRTSSLIQLRRQSEQNQSPIQWTMSSSITSTWHSFSALRSAASQLMSSSQFSAFTSYPTHRQSKGQIASMLDIPQTAQQHMCR